MFNVAERIRELCEKKNIGSVYELAKITGITQSTLQNITSGKNKNPRTDTIERICSGLGVTLAEFFSTNDFATDLHALAMKRAEDRNLTDMQKAALERLKEMPIDEQQSRFLRNLNRISPSDRETILKIINALAASQE